MCFFKVPVCSKKKTTLIAAGIDYFLIGVEFGENIFNNFITLQSIDMCSIKNVETKLMS